MRRFLIVGNQTLGSEELRAVVQEHLGAGPCTFRVLVPATPPRDLFLWSEGEANAIARQRLNETLGRMRTHGAVATGEIGDANPVFAVADVLRREGREQFDEIILSTFAPGLSRWIHQDLPHRLARSTGLPIHHVVAAVREPEMAQ